MDLCPFVLGDAVGAVSRVVSFVAVKGGSKRTSDGSGANLDLSEAPFPKRESVNDGQRQEAW
jgi:hypothetical protein